MNTMMILTPPCLCHRIMIPFNNNNNNLKSRFLALSETSLRAPNQPWPPLTVTLIEVAGKVLAVILVSFPNWLEWEWVGDPDLLSHWPSTKISIADLMRRQKIDQHYKIISNLKSAPQTWWRRRQRDGGRESFTFPPAGAKVEINKLA